MGRGYLILISRFIFRLTNRKTATQFFPLLFAMNSRNRATAVFIFFSVISIPVSAQEYCIDGRFDLPLFEAAQTEIISNIVYGSAVNYLGEEQNLKLDIYRPIPELDVLTKKPLIIFIHGGGLLGGSKSTPYAQYLGAEFSKRGFMFASIDYRLGWANADNCLGDTTSLQLAIYRAIQDTRAAVRYLKEKGEDFGIDTNFIFLSGYSVGSSIALNSGYAKQENFYSYQYEALGSIDSSTNDFYNHSMGISGIMAKAAGIDTTQIFDNYAIPSIFFHGTCDSILIYTGGPLYNCISPNAYIYYNGSRNMADALSLRNIPYLLYTNQGLGHEAAGDDTTMAYTSYFFKEILCNAVTSEEIYVVVTSECGPIQNDIYGVVPNPFHNTFNVNILINQNDVMTLEMYNILGQKVLSREYNVQSPNSKLLVDVSNEGLAGGYYILNAKMRGNSWTFSVIKL